MKRSYSDKRFSCKIIICKDAFKKQCVEKILAYKLNPSLREGLFFRDMSRIRCYFSFLAVCAGVLCVGELAVRDFSMRMLPYFIITLF